MNIEQVFNRKKQLIERDPSYKEFLKLFNKIADDAKSEEIKSVPVILRPYHNTNLSSDSKHIIKHPDYETFSVAKAGLELKWFVNIDSDCCSKKINIKPYTNIETLWIGRAPTIKGYKGCLLSDPDKFPQLEWLPYPNPFNKNPILAEINEFVNPAEKGRESLLPILIDLQRLNKSSAKQLKKYLWKIIDQRLPKGQKTVPSPRNEIRECSFLYSQTKNADKTFQNYLRWYDLHIEKLLGFRVIEFLEKEIKKGNNNVDALIDRLKNKRTPIGTRTSYQGEDKIEKGVKLIYEAIHRKKYPAKKDRHETFLDNYSCPVHSANKCPKSCNYYKQWEEIFTKVMPDYDYYMLEQADS